MFVWTINILSICPPLYMYYVIYLMYQESGIMVLFGNFLIVGLMLNLWACLVSRTKKWKKHWEPWALRATPEKIIPYWQLRRTNRVELRNLRRCSSGPSSNRKSQWGNVKDKGTLVGNGWAAGYIPIHPNICQWFSMYANYPLLGGM